MTKEEFIRDIRTGIPDTLPELQAYDPTINHAPKRKDILTKEEKSLLYVMHYDTSRRNSIRH